MFERREDKFPNIEIKSQKEINNELIELFEMNYGRIELTSEGEYHFKGNKNNFRGFAKTKEELAIRIIDWLVESEHVDKEETLRQTEDGFILTDTKCYCCDHEFVEDEDCYCINDSGDYICQTCHDVEFPTERSWYLYILEYHIAEDYENTIYTKEQLKEYTDEEISSLCSLVVASTDNSPYYTTAQ